MRKNAFTLVVLTMLIGLMSSVVSAAAYTLTVDADGPNQGKDTYQIFKDAFGKDPVDGADQDRIFEVSSPIVGNAFEFVVKSDDPLENNASQRNEVKVYNASRAELKAPQNSNYTYKWKFKLDKQFQFPENGKFFALFQYKAIGGENDDIPLLTFSLDGKFLKFYHNPKGSDNTQRKVLSQIDFTPYKDVWVEATVSVINSDNGQVAMTLTTLDGANVLPPYSGNQDMWIDGTSIIRPKWGIYRRHYVGIPEAKVQFANFQIMKH
ncbi:heparin lyase I family protein [Paenibacillus sp. 481]|uniref:heparin lyase I family protein n=1 Tax=Paenibacillus sp. 481 TaxID=2835869 RepID=UPI001E4A22DD|nr:heparin lyase I family protein [Paenibacillus sp. 481]UHA73952.1 heparin lyase I family protein [Paenibacillus sp. 481]